MTWKHRLAIGLVAVVVLVGNVAVPAHALFGFERLTVEEIDENTATCDFDGDGVYTDYTVTPEQTVLQRTKSYNDSSGITHLSVTTLFTAVEYTETTAEPPAFTNSSVNILLARLDGDTLLTAQSFGYGTLRDSAGEVLFRGPSSYEFVIEGGEIVDFVDRAPGGPCTVGIVND